MQGEMILMINKTGAVCICQIKPSKYSAVEEEF